MNGDTTYVHDEHIIIKDTNKKGNALAIMERAGAMFKVSYPPASYKDSTGYEAVPTYQVGKHEGENLYKWVVREDTGDVLGLHSGTYPQIESYRFLAEMAEQMFPNSTTGCTLIGNGERVMLRQDVSEAVDLDGDVIQPQVLWISSFNGTWSTSVMDSMYRWFCSNQIVTGHALFKCRHTENHNYTFETRAYVLEESVKRAHNFASMARVLKDQEYTDEQFKELILQLVPKPMPYPGETEVGERRWTIVRKKRDHMTNKWNEEREEWGEGTRWLAYNAVQGAEQHHINTGFTKSEAGIEKSLVKAIDGSTPLSMKALTLLAA